MWLITTFIAAVIITVLWYMGEGKNAHLLATLALIFWGTTVMVFIDHLINFLNGEEFIEVSADALILGIVMVFFGVFIWEIWLILKDPKGKLQFRAQHG